MYIKTPPQGGGNIQIVPSVDGNESTIGHYTRNDLRATTSGDTWISGANGYTKNAYSIGTPGINSCLSISNSGNVEMPYNIRTPEIKTSSIKILNTDGNIAFRNSLDNTIAVFYDDKTTIFQGNMTVNGNISANNIKPFWIAGKVDGSTLSILSTNGRYPFTVTRPSGYPTGVYYISFGDKPYSNAHYIINVSNQASLYCKIWETAIPTANGFTIVTYTTATTAGNCIFHFSVIA